jgi:hypothetical protein
MLALLIMSAAARADLYVPAPIFDAGEVRAGAPLSHEFTFRNRGPDAVEIINLESSCGCLTPRLEKRRYEPGERGSIGLEVNTLSPAPGPHTWQVKLSCRSGETVTEIPLRLTARLVREIIVEPAAVTLFVDGTVQTQLHVTDLRPHSLEILQVHTTSPALQAQLIGQQPDGNGRPTRRIELTVSSEFPEGRHEETLTLYTDDPAYREIRVPVTVVKRSPQRVTATPSRVELSARLPARMLLIRDRENQDVELESATADNPAITCRWAKGPGVMSTLKIQYDTQISSIPKLQTTIRVQVAKPTREVIVIPVTVSTAE